MKLTLRKLALGLAILAAGAMTAQDVVVTQNWIKQGLPGADKAVRSGSGVNGKCYLPAGSELYTMDGSGYKKVTLPKTFTMNKGLAVDDKGNIIVAPAFPTSATNWTKVKLISADFKTVTDITLAAPTNSDWASGRYDNVGSAIGDFMSEEGGLFYLVTSGDTYPVPIWIKNGKQHVTANAPSATNFPAANNMATAIPSVSSMADITDANVANLFYYRTGSDYTKIGYVNESGEAAYLPVPKNLPTGWTERSQNGFAVFTLGGKIMQVRMAGPAVWTNCWVLTDEQGNVLHAQDYTGDYASNGKTGDGCNIIARQIDPYKVELYQIYNTNTITAPFKTSAARGFCAMYTIEIPYIELDKTELDLIVGDSQKLAASVGISTMTDKSVTWTSSNPDVATVDAEGNVTAVAPGKATITAKSNGNGLTATCEVNVSFHNPVTAVSFEQSEISIIRGETATLTAIITPADATDKTLTWSSSNPEIATVDSKGVVTAIADGVTTITATAHTGVSGSCTVTVVPPVEVSEIKLDNTELSIIRGESETLTATVLPENATYPAITFSSSDKNIATVTNDGVITAHQLGTATITVTATNGVTATCTVTVEPNDFDIYKADFCVTQDWIKQGLPGGNGVVRSGSALNGKCYLPAGNILYTMDESGYHDVTLPESFTMNKGLAIDDKGNIIIAPIFPTTTDALGEHWDSVKLISADFSTITDLTLHTPTNSNWTGDRYDMVGNAIGDFMSEEGGLFYLTSTAEKAPIPIWIKNGEQHVTANATAAQFSQANSTATAIPSVSSMEDVTDSNVANLFYYRTGSMYTEIGYVNKGKAAYLTVPSKDMPSGWAEKSQNGFAVFNLGEHRMQVRMAGPANWTNFWVMSDDEGNVLHAQDYTGDYAPTGKTGNGCNLIARQINPYKVELYQIYTTNTPDKGFCAQYTIEVPHIVLDKTEITLETDDSEQLIASVGTAKMEDKSVTWSSSDPEVATVDDEGLVTAVAPGTATIEAISNGNGLEAHCDVTVKVSTGVETIAIGDEISFEGGDIIVAPGVEVSVYDISGRLVATAMGGKISGLAKGIYLITAPGKTPVKVAL
ncbi:MAG: Ig-like domain-containing protein [Muribaculaceae bacterium]|nr:Ig-like domain-containing protein [Muribaculaceae bacterium]